MPVLVYVNYPKKEGAKFEIEYYLNTHMKNVTKHWASYGLKGWKVVQFRDGDPSGLHVQAMMTWDSFEAFDKALAANIPEVMGDLSEYSSEYPTRYYGLVVAQG